MVSKQMSVSEALEILKKPIFGDAKCIEARNVIREDDLRKDLMDALKDVDCDCSECGGTGEIQCPECDGDGAIDLNDLDIGELIDLARREDIDITKILQENGRD